MFQLLRFAKKLVGFTGKQQLVRVLRLGDASVAMFNGGELVDFVKVPRDVDVFREIVPNIKTVLLETMDNVLDAVGQVVHRQTHHVFGHVEIYFRKFFLRRLLDFVMTNLKHFIEAARPLLLFLRNLFLQVIDV